MIHYYVSPDDIDDLIQEARRLRDERGGCAAVSFVPIQIPPGHLYMYLVNYVEQYSDMMLYADDKSIIIQAVSNGNQ